MFFFLLCVVTTFTTSHPFSEVKDKLEESRKTQQVKTELEDSRRARRESRELCQQDILDRAKFEQFVGQILLELGIPLGPMFPEMLLEQVGRLPGVVKERELSSARKVVHQVVTMFGSHY